MVREAGGIPSQIILPGLPEKGDILDWRGTEDDLIRVLEGAVPAAPIDLWQHYEAPNLPKGLLPEPIERFARGHAEVMGVDPAGLAMATLCVCAATLSDAIKLQVKRHDPTWCESARLWVGLVGSPSMKKTPIMSAALRPLKRIDANLMRAYTQKRQQYDLLSAKERKEAERPRQERRVISDATVEAAQEVLRDSPRGVLSAQDELSGWFGQMDKYAPGKGSQADRGFWLQAFNGGSYSLNRIARGASYIPNCSISLLGGIQPEPIRAIANDTHDDGLVQRLLPVILRPGKVGRDVPAGSTLSDYERLIERLEVMRAPAYASRMARYQGQIAERNKQLERESAMDAIVQGQDQQRQLGREVAGRIGAQEARMAGNNVDITRGSAARVLDDTRTIGREDSLALSENIRRQVESMQISAWNYESEKQARAAEARQAKTASYFGAGSTVLGGATQYANFRAKNGTGR